jgi:5,6,7,8-tetrahydromethanopterin hydro-lyase
LTRPLFDGTLFYKVAAIAFPNPPTLLNLRPRVPLPPGSVFSGPSSLQELSMPIRNFAVGESLVGDGNEVAHIDLIIGPKDGPAGQAFCNALTNNKDGFTTLLAVVAPNVPAKPDTIMFNKVTMKGAKQAVQMFGPAQAAVARAVVDAVSDGTISKNEADDLVVCVGVFIHWEAADDQKIYQYNYQATKEALARAMQGQPSVDEVISQKRQARHPFASGAEEFDESAREMAGA